MSRKKEAVDALRSKWHITSTDKDGIVEELSHAKDDLPSLMADVHHFLQKELLELLMEYYACFEAFLMESSSPKKVEDLFPSLCSGMSTPTQDSCQTLLESEQRDLLLDDCYCLLAFLKERRKQLAKETHSVVVSDSPVIMGILRVWGVRGRGRGEGDAGRDSEGCGVCAGRDRSDGGKSGDDAPFGGGRGVP